MTAPEVGLPILRHLDSRTGNVNGECKNIGKDLIP